MNWEAVGAVAELGGAFGVIATLIYLGVQIRHSSRTERAQMLHAVLSEFRSIISEVIRDPQLADAHTHVLAKQDIPAEVKNQYFYFLSNLFRMYEELHQHSQSNLIPVEFWLSRRGSMRDDYLAHPEIRSWWESGRHTYFSRDFRRLADELLKELDAGNRGSLLDN